MSKPRKDYKSEILEIIPKHPIFSFTDIFVFYKEIGRQHAYKLKYDRCDDIKSAIYANKRKGVTSLLSKWLKSESNTLQIAAMRMICDPDERRKLNQQYIEQQNVGKSTIIFENVSKK